MLGLGWSTFFTAYFLVILGFLKPFLNAAIKQLMSSKNQAQSSNDKYSLIVRIAAKKYHLKRLSLHTMSKRNVCALILILASLLCLYPGLFSNMLTIKVGKVVPFVGQLDLYEATQSIMQTIEYLFDDQNYLVAWLILVFSVVVPIVKIILLLIVLFSNHEKSNRCMFKFVSVIGKWSMADVFVVSIFMAFLATRSNEAVSATLHSGYYYFTAYCLLSILGTQLIERPNEKIGA